MILRAGSRQGAGMRRVGSAIATLALVTALSTGIVSLPAQAQGGLDDVVAARAAGEGPQRLLLEADELIYDNDRNRVIAAGNVEMYYGGRSLQADRVTYDRNTSRVFAEGNARLVDADGTVGTASFFELTDDFRSGFIDSLQVEQDISDDGFGRPGTGRFSARRAERIEGEQTIFHRGTYTACDTCEENPGRPPFWQVRAARVIHDKETKTIYYENAALEFLGVPVAYLPYFWSPDPTVKRKTGFLTPTISLNESLGPGVTVPFFWETGPNHDLTFRPQFLSRQGVLGDVEWRHRLLTGSYGIRATGIFQQDRTQFKAPPSGPGDRNFRGSIQTTGRFGINRRWHWGWDITGVTDKWYLDNYGINAATLTSHYDREAVSQVYLTGRGERSFFDLRGYYFKALATRDFQQHQPVVHPVLDYNKRIDAPPAIGGELALDVNFVSLSRETSQFRAADPRDPNARGRFGGIFDTCASGAFNRDQCLLPGVAGSYSRLTSQVSWRRQIIDRPRHGGEAVGLTGHKIAQRAGTLAAQRQEHRARGLGDGRHRLGLAGVADEERGTAVADEIVQLLRGVGGIERQEHHPRLEAGGVERQRLGRFLHMHRHPVARRHAERRERRGCAVGQREECRIAQRRAVRQMQEHPVRAFVRGKQRVVKRVGHGGMVLVVVPCAGRHRVSGPPSSMLR